MCPLLRKWHLNKIAKWIHQVLETDKLLFVSLRRTRLDATAPPLMVPGTRSSMGRGRGRDAVVVVGGHDPVDTEASHREA